MSKTPDSSNNQYENVDLLDFLIEDPSWQKNPETELLIVSTKRKLNDLLSNPRIDPTTRDYFRHVQEKLGFYRYCSVLTKTKHRCGNKIRHGDYCYSHLKQIMKKQKWMSQFFNLPDDITFKIATFI